MNDEEQHERILADTITTLREERDALKARVKELEAKHTEINNRATKLIDELTEERDALKARVARLESALRWYADRAHYIYPTHAPDVYDDDGERARAALEGKRP